jgi:pimeloyl-ACP methyl ester carboxylesterase
MGRTGWLLAALATGALAALALGALAPGRVLEGYFAAQRWAAGVQQQSAGIGDHRWTWLEAGEGPPLVLLHGFTGAKENWLPLIPELAGTHRVIAPDLPGWGDSTRLPGGDYGFAAQALRVNAFLAALGLQDTVLVGHSMGGGIAAVAASQRPPGVRGLVLMDAAGVPFAANAFAEAVQAGGHPFAVGGDIALERYLGLVFEDPPFVPWPISRALVERRTRDRPFEERVLAAIGRGAGAFVPQQAAGAIDVPTLLLWCAGDQVIDPSAAIEWQRAIGPAVMDTVLLDACNHMPMMERPEATAQALREFTGSL